MASDYPSFFGLIERPFSLTPEARYHYRSRSHARALASTSTGLARRVPLLLLTGEFGTGKSTLCRTLLRTPHHIADSRDALTTAPPRSRYPHRAEGAVLSGATSFIANALVTPEELYRRLLFDFRAVPAGAADRQRVATAGLDELALWMERTVRERAGQRMLVVLDEAHLMPPATVHAILSLVALDTSGDAPIQVLLSAQPPTIGAPSLPRALEEQVTHWARLTPLDRDECELYVQYRLRVAGGHPVPIPARTLDVLFTLSNGLPRLINLLCERAFQEAAIRGMRRIDPPLLEAAAISLEMASLRTRRVRRPEPPRGTVLA
ncbi:MAG: AAA family ATPase [Acidobacteria bacterium]|nr:AAA family ATPase [Acidobacteriota bacterium]